MFTILFVTNDTRTCSFCFADVKDDLRKAPKRPNPSSTPADEADGLLWPQILIISALTEAVLMNVCCRFFFSFLESVLLCLFFVSQSSCVVILAASHLQWLGLSCSCQRLSGSSVKRTAHLKILNMRRQQQQQGWCFMVALRWKNVNFLINQGASAPVHLQIREGTWGNLEGKCFFLWQFIIYIILHIYFNIHMTE